MRKINKSGLNLIKKYEGCKLTSYICPAGVLTIGYGHTGKDVKPNQTITKKKAISPSKYSVCARKPSNKTIWVTPFEL